MYQLMHKNDLASALIPWAWMVLWEIPAEHRLLRGF